MLSLFITIKKAMAGVTNFMQQGIVNQLMKAPFQIDFLRIQYPVAFTARSYFTCHGRINLLTRPRVEKICCRGPINHCPNPPTSPLSAT